MAGDLGGLERIIGHSFRDQDLLRRALTHKSHSAEQSVTAAGQPQADNEQLEFLGDAVLGFLISEHLVGRYVAFGEGRLSKLRARLVSEAHLYEVARKLDLGCYLFLGRGEEMSGGRAKRTLLADAFEAVIAAVYLDGGVEGARRFVLEAVVGDFDPADTSSGETTVDFKSALQETAQCLGLPQPRYVIVGENGPEHSKTFSVEVRVGRDLVERAEGFSKKSAGQKAARLALSRLAAACLPAQTAGPSCSE